MRKIKKLHVLSKTPVRPNSPYTPIFSLRTKILIFSGLILLIVSGFFYLNQTIQLMINVPNVPVVVKETIYPVPDEILIPSVSLTLPVESTAIRGNIWQVSSKGVSHLAISANPGEPGPIIMYAHNTNTRFGPIRWMKKGQAIILHTINQKTRTYMVTETVRVKPEELSIFFKRKEETLYLYTCDGFADLQRFVVIATPQASGSAN